MSWVWVQHCWHELSWVHERDVSSTQLIPISVVFMFLSFYSWVQLFSWVTGIPNPEDDKFDEYGVTEIKKTVERIGWRCRGLRSGSPCYIKQYSGVVGPKKMERYRGVHHLVDNTCRRSTVDEEGHMWAGLLYPDPTKTGQWYSLGDYLLATLIMIDMNGPDI